MLIDECIHKVIFGKGITSRKQLLMFWEQYYINFTEDVRADEYQRLKKEYFRLADKYENMLKSKPSFAEDELLYKKYMIKQRKIGIQMIAASSGTVYETEARTFESQMFGTPAGDRSATNIKHTARTASGEEYKYPRGKDLTFIEFIKMLFREPAYRKRMLINVLFGLSTELFSYLLSIIIRKKRALTATSSEHWSEIVGQAAGESVIVKIQKSRLYDVFAYRNIIVVSSKIIEVFNEKEVIALSLYSHGMNKAMLATGATIGTIRSIIISSSEVILAYGIYKAITKYGTNNKVVIASMSIGYYKGIVIAIIMELLRTKLLIANSIKFVKDKGYANHLMSAKKKLPKKRAETIPNINTEIASKSISYFVRLLNIIKLKDKIEKDDVSSSMSVLKKTTSIFKKFK